MQMSAMKACFQIAECSLSSAKIIKKIENSLIKLIIIGNPFQQVRLSYIVQYVIKV